MHSERKSIDYVRCGESCLSAEAITCDRAVVIILNASDTAKYNPRLPHSWLYKAEDRHIMGGSLEY